MTDDLEVLLPCDQLAEHLILANVFYAEDPEAFSRMSELLSVASFTTDKHRLLFRTMQSLFERGVPVNLGSVFLELKKTPGSLEIVGSLTEWENKSPVGLVNLSHFCEVVAEKQRLREILNASETMIQRILKQDPSSDVREEGLALLAGADTSKRGKSLRPSEILTRAGGLDRLIRPGGHAIMTPWERVNRSTNGLRSSQLWIVGGLPGTGKTSLGLQVMDTAITAGFRVKLISREMSADEVLINMACTRAHVDNQELHSGTLNPIQRQGFQSAMTYYVTVGDDLLEIDDTSASTVPAIAAGLRRNIAQGRPVDLVVVDFLQLLHGVGRVESRRHEIDQIAYGLKELARSFKIPVLALAQLNVRKLESDAKSSKPAPPSLGDFRESGAVEQAADVAFILRLTDVEQQFHHVQLVDAYLLKQRAGKKGKIAMKFHSVYRVFEEVPLPQVLPYVGRKEEYACS